VRIESFKRVIAQTRKELTELLRDRLAIARGSGSDKSRILALCSDIDCTGRS